jgi:hypothetical protein
MMNERIEQLASQAGMLRDKYGLYWNAHDNPDDGVDLEKFVELIVKECAKVLTQHGAYFSGDGEPYHYAASLIEEHFGVE